MVYHVVESLGRAGMLPALFSRGSAARIHRQLPPISPLWAGLIRP